KLAEDAYRFARIGHVELQGHRRRIVGDLERRREHQRRPRLVVTRRRGHRPTLSAARQPARADRERLARHFLRVDADDEDALDLWALRERERYQQPGDHAATRFNTRVITRSR